MADHLALTLGPASYATYKMVPYGPVQAVTKYLLRRAQENSSVLGGVQPCCALLCSYLLSSAPPQFGPLHQKAVWHPGARRQHAC